jgi:hypothetical protein
MFYLSLVALTRIARVQVCGTHIGSAVVLTWVVLANNIRSAESSSRRQARRAGTHRRHCGRSGSSGHRHALPLEFQTEPEAEIFARVLEYSARVLREKRPSDRPEQRYEVMMERATIHANAGMAGRSPQGRQG